MLKFIKEKELFVFDGFVGADLENRMPIRVITDKAWQNLFATQLFVRPTLTEMLNHVPRFTLLSVNDFGAMTESEGTRSETFIIISFKKRLVLIGSTSYAGEIKKAFFSVMNYFLPRHGVPLMSAQTEMQLCFLGFLARGRQHFQPILKGDSLATMSTVGQIVVYSTLREDVMQSVSI
jgi:ATP-dependent phosphoenolpyruvate carboxykinase